MDNLFSTTLITLRIQQPGHSHQTQTQHNRVAWILWCLLQCELCVYLLRHCNDQVLVSFLFVQCCLHWQLLRPMYIYMHLWNYLCPPLVIPSDIRPHEHAINLELDSQPLLVHEDGLDGKCLGEINIESCWRNTCARNTWRASVYSVCKTPTTSIRIHGASEFSSNLPIWGHQVVHSSRKYLLSEMGSTDGSAPKATSCEPSIWLQEIGNVSVCHNGMAEGGGGGKLMAAVVGNVQKMRSMCTRRILEYIVAWHVPTFPLPQLYENSLHK